VVGEEGEAEREMMTIRADRRREVAAMVAASAHG
jgi:hypothetical protein